MLTEEIKELLNTCFPLPPMDVPESTEEMISQYTTHIITRYDGRKLVGLLMVPEVGQHIYGISNLCVHPDYRNRGIAKALLNDAHMRYKGIFILKTKNQDIYLKNGYVRVGGKILVYSNIETIDW